MIHQPEQLHYSSDILFMQRALELARYAETIGEIPVGAVLVYQDKIIGEGWNQPISKNDPTVHAEMMAIQKGAMAVGNYRLVDTTLYVTLEPCMMCAGALVHARIHRLVFGASDPKSGVIHSVAQLLESTWLNHPVKVTGGVLQDEASNILKTFFLNKRREKK